MEWLTTIRESIEFIEAHLTDDITAQDVSDAIFMSPMHLQRGFQTITGYSVSEYIRNRRLYLAALELAKNTRKIIDIALDFGYDTPESFTKAFTRFHGITPSEARAGAEIRSFLPLTIKLSVQGGDYMDFKITQLNGFKLIGYARQFSYTNSYAEIPKFWDEVMEQNDKALGDFGVGEFGICIDDVPDSGKFTYMIAGKYTGGEVPEGLSLYELPAADWAVFDCYGPIPDALQSMNTRIFREWLPGNPDYEIDGAATVEWYDCTSGLAENPEYHSAIWIPVKKK